MQTVRRWLRLRRLSAAVRAAFDHAEITTGAAEAIARLRAEHQRALERTLRPGQRITLAATRQIARQGTTEAAVTRDAALFGERRTPW